jgi:hypothetical protein
MDVSSIQSFTPLVTQTKYWNLSPTERGGHDEEDTRIEESNAATQSLSEEESEFFVNLFPGSADAIRSYASYDKGGTKTPTHIGTLVDKKG